METKPTTVRQGTTQDQDLSAKGMDLLTGGLTREGDTFLIAVAAVLITALLYPLVDALALLSFVFVPIVAVLVRSRKRRRRTGR